MSSSSYAGFRWRLLASVVDIILGLLIIMPLLTWIHGPDYWYGGKLVYGIWDVLLNYVFPVAITIWFWRRFLGTPGKILCQLRVLDEDTYKPLSIKQSVVRYLSYVLSTLPLFAGFLWVIFDKKKQAWHDKLAGSVVVRGDIEKWQEMKLNASGDEVL